VSSPARRRWIARVGALITVGVIGLLSDE
jgi:hypothetical protein